MDGVGGYAGWRWIFILEGLLTVAVALVAPFAIHDFPETATFLTEEERRWVIHKLRSQSGRDTTQDGTDHEESRFRVRYVLDALTDWQIYVALFSMLPLCVARRRLVGLMDQGGICMEAAQTRLPSSNGRPSLCVNPLFSLFFFLFSFFLIN